MKLPMRAPAPGHHHPVRRRFLLGLVALCAGVGVPCAQAQAALSAVDTGAVRAVIQAQLQAFANDDAEQAFSLASNDIRRQFGSAQAFMAMVRGSYPAVYRPAAVAFLKPEWAGAQVVQALQLTDLRGKSWLALYRMQRLDDGSWRIAGCVLSANEGQTS